MPFDPTKPVNGSAIVAAELRNQFNSLNDGLGALIAQVGDLPSMTDVQSTIEATTPAPLGGYPPLALTVSNPPTQTEVQAIADKLDDLINALKR